MKTGERVRGAALGIVVLLSVVAPRVDAIVTFGNDVEVEGFVNLQNILRTPRFEDAEFVMQRNTAQVEGKYYFLRDGQAFGQFDTGPLEEATFTFIGRAVYDSIYDLRSSYRDAYRGHDDPGDPEVKAREAFVDLVLPPFSLRLGRQQVVWGETDNFRALDIINPLDLSWHWVWESWEDIRIPLWMARGIYDIGKLGSLEESFVEVVWVPWDVRTNVVATDPRQPWAFTGRGLSETPNAAVIDGQLLDLRLRVLDGTPGRKLENGQAGLRFKGIWGGVEFSLNYFYGFSADAGVRVRQDLARIQGQTLRAVVETVHPRSHVIGFTANYSEERFTQAVFRVETAFTTGVPVAVAPGAPRAVDPEQDQFEEAKRTVVMLAIDRPTWIRPLNELRTFFLSTQIFWRRYLEHSTHYRGFSAVRQAELDGVQIPGRFVSDNTDRLDRNEFVLTFAASTSYGAAGLIQPRFVFAIDPRSTGAYNQLAVDYLLSNHVVLRFQQNLFWRIRGEDPGPWALGDLWGHSSGNSRHESVFSLIYQF